MDIETELHCADEAKLIELIKSRRSVRRYAADFVEPELVQQVLEAALWSPSAHNRQPWRFAVLSDGDYRHKLAIGMGERLRQDLIRDGLPAAVIDSDVNRSYERIVKAPVVILVALTTTEMDEYPDELRRHNERVMAIQSAAMAGQTLMLAAHALGLASCWMCAPLFSPEQVVKGLDLPTDWQPQGLITLGYPDGPSRGKSREPLSTRVLWR